MRFVNQAEFGTFGWDNLLPRRHRDGRQEKKWERKISAGRLGSDLLWYGLVRSGLESFPYNCYTKHTSKFNRCQMRVKEQKRARADDEINSIILQPYAAFARATLPFLT